LASEDLLFDERVFKRSGQKSHEKIAREKRRRKSATDLLQRQKRPTTETKETYYRDKRDLLLAREKRRHKSATEKHQRKRKAPLGTQKREAKYRQSTDNVRCLRTRWVYDQWLRTSERRGGMGCSPEQAEVSFRLVDTDSPTSSACTVASMLPLMQAPSGKKSEKEREREEREREKNVCARVRASERASDSESEREG